MCNIFPEIGYNTTPLNFKPYGDMIFYVFVSQNRKFWNCAKKFREIEWKWFGWRWFHGKFLNVMWVMQQALRLISRKIRENEFWIITLKLISRIFREITLELQIPRVLFLKNEPKDFAISMHPNSWDLTWFAK